MNKQIKELHNIKLLIDVKDLVECGIIAEINNIYLGSFDILLYLYAISENSIATSSLQTIARNTGFSRETVRKMVRELENHNIIMRLHCARGKEMDYALRIKEDVSMQ